MKLEALTPHEIRGTMLDRIPTYFPEVRAYKRKTSGAIGDRVWQNIDRLLVYAMLKSLPDNAVQQRSEGNLLVTQTTRNWTPQQAHSQRSDAQKVNPWIRTSRSTRDRVLAITE
jgi:hypothetical protein